MSTGAIMLAGGSVVALSDLAFGLYYRSLADRVESGEKVATSIDPANARRITTMLIVFAPIMWLIFFFMSFGIIPVGGIDPIQF